MSVILGGYGISYRFRAGSREVLNDITFELTRGEITALVGPNGSGKSTLMKLVAGILPRGSGQVRYLGKDLWFAATHERARTIAYVGSELSAEFPLSAREAVLLGRTCWKMGGTGQGGISDSERAQAAMEKCLCWDLRDRKLDTLSGGERQLVLLARALVQDPRILFLDESLSKMDLNHQGLIGAMLRDLTRSGGLTVMWVSHDLNLALEWADSALLLVGGRKVAYGPVRDVVTEESLRVLYPGARLVLGQNPRSGAPQVFMG